MFNVKSVSRIVLLGLILALAIGVGVVAVGAGQSDNGESGFEPPDGRSTEITEEEVTGEETVTGEEPAQSDDNFMSNAEGAPSTGSAGVVEEEVELVESPDDSPLAQFFTRTAGSNFTPRDSDTTYSYFGGGCMQRDSNVGDSWFTMDLRVPDGAEIDFLRVYYYDNNGTYDINSELWAFDGAGGTTLIAEADSTGSPGYSTAGSGFFSHIVDNINESLVVVASIQGGVGSDLALCGVRLRYQYSLGAAHFLPAVLNLTAP